MPIRREPNNQGAVIKVNSIHDSLARRARDGLVESCLEGASENESARRYGNFIA
jgi:hypothetical protein